jgi:hypothetical protein
MKSGVYHYYLNDEPSSVMETFRVEQGAGETMTTATRDAGAFGVLIHVETRETDGELRRAEIIFQGQTEVRAIYEKSGGNLYFNRCVNGETVDIQEILMPADALLFPLMRCFQGRVILRAAQEGGAGVMIPSIENPADTEKLLTPTFEQRTARLLRTDGNQSVFNYLTKRYDERSEFWLDGDGLLVKYEFQQAPDKRWSCRLLGSQSS